MNRNPEYMTTEDVVSEISTLQNEIRTRALRVHELGNFLYRRARRNPVDDSTAIYVTYANATMRFAGAVSQILSRTTRVARVLRRLPQESVTKAPKERPVIKPELSPVESLISSYSSEPVLVDEPINEMKNEESV